MPLLTLIKPNRALLVAVEPRSRSCVVIRCVIAPLPCSNGDPPLVTGRMPVTSVDARLTALVERTPEAFV